MFSFCDRDGTSVVLSDDVGQIYLLNTGQGESQKDAKYDQVHEILIVQFFSPLSCFPGRARVPFPIN
jgi:hypothetical protein